MEHQNDEELNEMHDKAMEYSGLAGLAKIRGNHDESVRLYQQAFDMEQYVALQVAKTTLEPSRSVLLRSAASLAYICGRYDDAIRLIATALEGKPPAEIVAELHEVWDNVFHALHAMREETAGD
jgi:hypothetical protein